MDMMLEEELIDLMTFCLQNPDSSEIDEKHTRIKEIGQEIFDDGLCGHRVARMAVQVILEMW